MKTTKFVLSVLTFITFAILITGAVNADTLFSDDFESENLDIWLQKTYEEIEPFYKEIMRRYSKPIQETIPSKINGDKEFFKELTYRWDYS